MILSIVPSVFIKLLQEQIIINFFIKIHIIIMQSFQHHQQLMDSFGFIPHQGKAKIYVAKLLWILHHLDNNTIFFLASNPEKMCLISLFVIERLNKLTVEAFSVPQDIINWSNTFSKSLHCFSLSIITTLMTQVWPERLLPKWWSQQGHSSKTNWRMLSIMLETVMPREL